MSIYYSKFDLNTYRSTPYFEVHIPKDYPLCLVMQKCRAFRRLPNHLRKLSRLAKKWAVLNGPSGRQEIDKWYDSSGNELDPKTGRKLTDAEIDALWGPDPSLDQFLVTDISIPSGGFADPSTWKIPPGSVVMDDDDYPDKAELLAGIATRGREATAAAYGIPIKELP